MAYYVDHAPQLFLSQLTNDFRAVTLTLVPNQKTVYAIYDSFTQEDLNEYSSLLSHAVQDCWLTNDATSGFRVCDAGPRVSIPKICVGPAFKAPMFFEQHEPLLYFMVVQGKNNAERSKLVLRYSLNAAASAIFHEALNGYSIAFSGAMLREDGRKIFSANAFKLPRTFHRVGTLAELRPMGANRADERIGVWC